MLKARKLLQSRWTELMYDTQCSGWLHPWYVCIYVYMHACIHCIHTYLLRFQHACVHTSIRLRTTHSLTSCCGSWRRGVCNKRSIFQRGHCLRHYGGTMALRATCIHTSPLQFVDMRVGVTVYSRIWYQWSRCYVNAFVCRCNATSMHLDECLVCVCMICRRARTPNVSGGDRRCLWHVALHKWRMCDGNAQVRRITCCFLFWSVEDACCSGGCSVAAMVLLAIVFMLSCYHCSDKQMPPQSATSRSRFCRSPHGINISICCLPFRRSSLLAFFAVAFSSFYLPCLFATSLSSLRPISYLSLPQFLSVLFASPSWLITSLCVSCSASSRFCQFAQESCLHCAIRPFRWFSLMERK